MVDRKEFDRKEIEGIAATMALPIASEMGVRLWDVLFVREYGQDVLRFILDGLEGKSIDLAECEAFSRAIEKELDRTDPIESGYSLEVESAGVGRALSRPEHFAAFTDSVVEVVLTKRLGSLDVQNCARLQLATCDKPISSDVSSFCATLRGFDGEREHVHFEDEVGNLFSVPLAEVKTVRLFYDWRSGKRQR